jgi:hypothetical protein
VAASFRMSSCIVIAISESEAPAHFSSAAGRRKGSPYLKRERVEAPNSPGDFAQPYRVSIVTRTTPGYK